MHCPQGFQGICQTEFAIFLKYPLLRGLPLADSLSAFASVARRTLFFATFRSRFPVGTSDIPELLSCSAFATIAGTRGASSASAGKPGQSCLVQFAR